MWISRFSIWCIDPPFFSDTWFLLSNKVLELQVKPLTFAVAPPVFEAGVKPSKVVHIDALFLREKIDIIFARPENGGNIGAALRAIANMGIDGKVKVVGSPCIINDEARKFSCHAKEALDKIIFFSSLAQALEGEGRSLVFAATARIGSPGRPHPVGVREAVGRGIEKLKSDLVDRLVFVFGSESDGLTNSEVAQCDWVVTIPSSDGYRSLNLAQAVLIFAYETQMALIKESSVFETESASVKPSQRERLISHVVQVAEEVGFILPGDPFKMGGRLEEILNALPKHIPEIGTLHGLLDQVSRSVKKGAPDVKGRFKQFSNEDIKNGNR